MPESITRYPITFVRHVQVSVCRLFGEQRAGRVVKGIHGITHWVRVRDNAIRILDRAGLLDDHEERVALATAFAFVHDAGREHDGYDTAHGLIGSFILSVLVNDTPKKLSEFDAKVLEVSVKYYGILSYSIHHHTVITPHHVFPSYYKDVGDIGRCLVDADALDVARTGVSVIPSMFRTGWAVEEYLSNADMYAFRPARYWLPQQCELIKTLEESYEHIEG